MAKRVVVPVSGVEKRIKKPPMRRRIRRNKKTLVKRLVGYLKSDSYLFAPLLSHYPCNFLPQNAVVSSSTAGVDSIENRKGENKSLVHKVGNYLNSDSFLYAPLFAPHLITSSSKGEKEMKGVRVEVSRRVEESNVAVEKVKEGGRRSISGQEKLVHKETVKHMVYQSCRSSSVSGKQLSPRLRKCLIE